MEATIDRQVELLGLISKIQTNFRKDSPSRKTQQYLTTRLEALDNLWAEFEQNHVVLRQSARKENEYFTENIYDQAKEVYTATRGSISSYGKEEKAIQPDGEIDSLLSLQRTHFRAFNRLLKGIDVNTISEKWEIEDELAKMQLKWNTIDELHIRKER